jgi:tRNA pseudouridine55 synthase
MYSALKRGGVPLYRLARRGIDVERAPRRVVISALALEEYRWPHVVLRVRCSKGTYIRTLVEDIAAGLGTVAHVAALRRLSVVPFAGRAMHELDGLRATDAAGGLPALDSLLLSPDLALPDWPAIELREAEATRFTQGQALTAEAAWPAGAVRVYAEQARFIALGTVTRERQLEPERVFRR